MLCDFLSSYSILSYTKGYIANKLWHQLVGIDQIGDRIELFSSGCISNKVDLQLQIYYNVINSTGMGRHIMIRDIF